MNTNDSMANSTLVHSIKSSSSDQSEHGPSTAWSALEQHISRRMLETTDQNSPTFTNDNYNDKSSKEVNIISPSNSPVPQKKRNLLGLFQRGAGSTQTKKGYNNYQLSIIRRLVSKDEEKDDAGSIQIEKASTKDFSKKVFRWFPKSVDTDPNLPSIPSKISMKSFELDDRQSDVVVTKQVVLSQRRVYKDTTESQQRLWLYQVHRVVRDYAVQQASRTLQYDESSEDSGICDLPKILLSFEKKVVHSPRALPSVNDNFEKKSEILKRPFLVPKNNTEVSKTRKKRDFNAHKLVVDDDEQSLSEMELLFNWLSCVDTECVPYIDAECSRPRKQMRRTLSKKMKKRR